MSKRGRNVSIGEFNFNPETYAKFPFTKYSINHHSKIYYFQIKNIKNRQISLKSLNDDYSYILMKF